MMQNSPTPSKLDKKKNPATLHQSVFQFHFYISHTATLPDHCLTNGTAWETGGRIRLPTVSVYYLMNNCSRQGKTLWVIQYAPRALGKWSVTVSWRSLRQPWYVMCKKNPSENKKHICRVTINSIWSPPSHGCSNEGVPPQQLEPSRLKTFIPWSNKIISFLNPSAAEMCHLFERKGEKRTSEAEEET